MLLESSSVEGVFINQNETTYSVEGKHLKDLDFIHQFKIR